MYVAKHNYDRQLNTQVQNIMLKLGYRQGKVRQGKVLDFSYKGSRLDHAYEGVIGTHPVIVNQGKI